MDEEVDIVEEIKKGGSHLLTALKESGKKLGEKAQVINKEVVDAVNYYRNSKNFMKLYEILCRKIPEGEKPQLEIAITKYWQEGNLNYSLIATNSPEKVYAIIAAQNPEQARKSNLTADMTKRKMYSADTPLEAVVQNMTELGRKI